jgi:hypothetical protein
MNHPYNRAERRYNRARVIEARKFIKLHIFNQWETKYDLFIKQIINPLIDINYLIERLHTEDLSDFPDWIIEYGRYAKFNLNCGCKSCHYYKYYKEKRKRRRSLKQIDLDWERQYK